MLECKVAQQQETAHATFTVTSPTRENAQEGHAEDSSATLGHSPHGLAAPTDAPQMASKHSRSDVSPHNNEKSLWIILDGKVYDVTKFVDDHPGGSEVLLDRAGEDCTEAFEELGHSEMAREMRKQYCIGTVKDTDWTKMSSPPRSGKQTETGDQSMGTDDN